MCTRCKQPNPSLIICYSWARVLVCLGYWWVTTLKAQLWRTSTKSYSNCSRRTSNKINQASILFAQRILSYIDLVNGLCIIRQWMLVQTTRVGQWRTNVTIQSTLVWLYCRCWYSVSLFNEYAIRCLQNWTYLKATGLRFVKNRFSLTDPSNRFWSDSIEPLLVTIDRLLKRDKNSMFVLSFQTRAKNTEAFLFKKAEELGFVIEDVPLNSFVQPGEVGIPENFNLGLNYLKLFKRKGE